MKYKSITYLFITILFTAGCHSQIKTNTMEINKIIKEIVAHHNSYPQEPTYYIGINSSACSFQLLVNDMPINSFFDKGGLSGTKFPINMYITQSGMQTVSVKVYPGRTGKNMLAPLIEDNAILKLTLAVTDWKNNTPMNTINDRLLTLPLKEGKPECTGLPYIEYSTTFNAVVPYKTNGWINGVNLEKEDSEKVKMETIAIYEKIRVMKSNKDIASELFFSKNAMIEFGQSLYRKEQDIKDFTNDWAKIYNNTAFHMDTLSPCIIKYYGNGKVVALERSDLFNRDESAIIMNYNNGDDKRMRSSQVLLFRPQKNAPLEIIR